MSDTTTGILMPPETQVLCNTIGTADDNQGKLVYNIGTLPNGAPCLQHADTGNYFTIPWEEIITLAEKAGIQNKIPTPAEDPNPEPNPETPTKDEP